MHSLIPYKINWNPEDYINFDDFNRIENNTGFVSEYFKSFGYEITLTLKEDWSRTTIPFSEVTKRILDNMKLISLLHYPPPVLPLIPSTFDNVDSTDMGNIENYLKTLYDYMERASAQFSHCGELICGQDFSYV